MIGWYVLLVAIIYLSDDMLRMRRQKPDEWSFHDRMAIMCGLIAIVGMALWGYASGMLTSGVGEFLKWVFF